MRTEADQNTYVADPLLSIPADFDQQVITQADIAKVYTTVDQLNSDSVIVIEGTVQKMSQFNHKVNNELVPYTVFEVQITETRKGNVKSGDIVTVAQYGGILTVEEAKINEKFPDMSEAEKS